MFELALKNSITAPKITKINTSWNLLATKILRRYGVRQITKASKHTYIGSKSLA